MDRKSSHFTAQAARRERKKGTAGGFDQRGWRRKKVEAASLLFFVLHIRSRLPILVVIFWV